MINSQFLRLAQQYGLSKVPQSGDELMAALQGILTPDQMELMQYLFQPPEVFQNNPINQLLPVDAADTGANPATPVAQNADAVEPPPAKDKASAAVTQPSAPDAPAPGSPAAAAAAGPQGAARYEGASGFNAPGAPAPYRLAANDPDAEALMAKYPGMYTWAGKPAAATTAPATATQTGARPFVPAVTAPVGTPVAGADRSGKAGTWDPGDATHPPRFIPSS